MISQKKATFHLLAPLIFVIIGAIAIFSTFFKVDYSYHYAQIEQKINTSFASGIYSARGEIILRGDATSLVFAVDRATLQDPDDISVTWKLGDQVYTRLLETDGQQDDTSRYYTFPFVTDKKGIVSYEIHSVSLIPNVSIIQTDIDADPAIAFENPFTQVKAADGALSIVTRQEWGADERLRFWDDERVAKDNQEWLDRGKTPFIVYETEQERHARELDIKRGARIQELRGDVVSTVSIQRYEGGKKLIWPIKTTKKVDRIIVHHTAENLAQDADDATLIRAIYAYHARTRGWGDIGYNFIIGQRGQIYEGRAGGAYVDGAHTYLNNLGSVGISVIGNFEVMQVNKDQKRGLEEAIVFFAKKYGINILETTPGVRLCKPGASADCLLDENILPRLMAHRDVGYTSCPGKNLYSLLDDMRTNLATRIGPVIPVENTKPGIIEPVPPEDQVEYRLKGTSLMPMSKKPALVLGGGKPIKIKLSYPDEQSITLSGPSYKKPDIRIGKRKILPALGTAMKVEIKDDAVLAIEIGGKNYRAASVSFASDVVRIDSWTRIPTWDIAKQYNDNTFRGKITIYNNKGKLLVVNELPLESYLRGLGEVSNGDLDEKIKTIIVAARSYARHYMDPKNRKYNTTLYDGSDDPDSFQKYLGYSYELRSPHVTELVNATRNQMITYEGKVVKAWYFSSSDGRTLSYKEYCEMGGSMNCMNIPYLQSVSDPGGVGRSRAGHGVGISGIGSTYFATQGWSYKKIIEYYMPGVKILKKI